MARKMEKCTRDHCYGRICAGNYMECFLQWNPSSKLRTPSTLFIQAALLLQLHLPGYVSPVTSASAAAPGLHLFHSPSDAVSQLSVCDHTHTHILSTKVALTSFVRPPLLSPTHMHTHTRTHTHTQPHTEILI